MSDAAPALASRASAPRDTRPSRSSPSVVASAPANPGNRATGSKYASDPSAAASNVTRAASASAPSAVAGVESAPRQLGRGQPRGELRQARAMQAERRPARRGDLPHEVVGGVARGADHERLGVGRQPGEKRVRGRDALRGGGGFDEVDHSDTSHSWPIVHGRDPAFDVSAAIRLRYRSCTTTRAATSRSISASAQPSSRRISAECSPRPGGKRGDALAVPYRPAGLSSPGLRIIFSTSAMCCSSSWICSRAYSSSHTLLSSTIASRL